MLIINVSVTSVTTINFSFYALCFVRCACKLVLVALNCVFVVNFS